MRRGGLFLLLAAIGGAVAYFIWGNPISVFILVAFLISVYYFLSTLRSERYVLQKFKHPIERRKTFERHKALNTTLVMLVLYLSSLIVLRYYTQPWDHTPYFNNTDYTMLMNTGVGFDSELRLYTSQNNLSEPGLYHARNGSLDVRRAASDFELLATDFSEPIFIKKDKRWTVQNNAYDQALAAGYKIANTEYALSVAAVKKHKPWYKSESDVYSIDLVFENLKRGTKDTIYVHKYQIKKGISLFDLLLKSSEKKVEFSAGARSRIDKFLYQTRNTLVLANLGEDNFLTVFPSPEFYKNGYTISQNGNPLNKKRISKIKLPAEADFYVGLSRSMYRHYVSSDAALAKPVLRFHYNMYYPLSTAASNAQLGFTQIRFIASHYKKILEHNLKEGFLLQENLRNTEQNNVDAMLHYKIDRPGNPLEFKVMDQNLKKYAKVHAGQVFSLKSQDGKLDWVVQLKDFYQSKFSFARIFVYLSVLFLAILGLLLYRPSVHLTRLEPIIFGIIYSFVVFRMLLLWRVATFPPLEGISNHELSTLRNFDFNFLGLDLPLPMTLLAPLLFVLGLSLYRSPKLHDESRPSYSERLSLMTTKLSLGKWLTAILPRDVAYRNMTVELLLYFGAGIIMFLVSKSLGVDFLLRIFAILYPIIIYFWLSGRYGSTEPRDFGKRYKSRFVQYTQEFIYYLQSNPSFYVALSALAYFMITDRGFGIMFMLFLFIKSMFFNFLSTRFSGHWREMFFSPRKFWIYGLLSFLIIVVFLAWKGAFLFLLQHKVYILGILLLVVALYLYLLDRRKYLRLTTTAAVLSLICLIPFSSKMIDHVLNNQLRHVIYRAAIICEPIDGLIYKSKASSFEERKIYESAENQWFINSYLSKTYNNKQAINLRPHFNSGVNYSTQTRDVVLPRYVISEHGRFVMLVLLFLLMLPFVFFQMSYGLVSSDQETGAKLNAVPGKSLLLFFSIGFFVWLTSTNRFVFFGQDFPFLSLTSKMSLLLPLVVFGFLLVSRPKEKYVVNMNVQLGAVRQTVLAVAIIIVLLVAGRSSLLNNKFFQIRLQEPEYVINQKFNALLLEQQLQKNYSYKDKRQILDSVFATDDFKLLYKNSTVYTQSVLDILKRSPSLAETTTSPIFLRYDNGFFKAEYNKNLHLELPAYDNKQAWKGDILEHYSDESLFDRPYLVYGNLTQRVDKPRAHYRNARSGVALLPNTWLMEDQGSIALVDLHNTKSDNSATIIQTYNPKREDFTVQDMRGYVTPLRYHDVSIITSAEGETVVSLNPDNGSVFMSNFWLNGKQRMMYPMSEKFFYIYHLAHSFRDMHKERNQLDKDIELTLNYKLQEQVSDLIQERYKNNTDPKIKMAAIAANSLGELTYMSDYNPKRRRLDPNDLRSINEIKQDQFFFSSNSSERDQWGDVNLMQMAYGPGSSIKPAVAAVIASQLSLPWNSIVLKASGVFRSSYRTPGRTATYQYAGYKLARSIGWEDEPAHTEHLTDIDFSDFIINSSNFYHSVLLFMGSYPKDSFRDESGAYSLEALLSKDSRGGKNKFPMLQTEQGIRYLPDYEEDRWPTISKDKKGYFDNPQALLPQGLALNYAITVEDQEKQDYSMRSNAKVNFTSSKYFDSLKNQSTSAAVWSFPEPSYFLQEDRAYKDPSTNFIMGMRNPSLGGAPWYLTPLKMLEVYGSLYSQNNLYRVHITPRKALSQDWNIDPSWEGAGFSEFLSTYIFTNMHKVITEGTARGLGAVLGAREGVYRDYHLYAKTGTIGSKKENSKRFALIISKQDLTQVQNLTKPKFYVLYFTLDNIGNNDWNLYKQIVDALMDSPDFKNFMS